MLRPFSKKSKVINIDNNVIKCPLGEYVDITFNNDIILTNPFKICLYKYTNNKYVTCMRWSSSSRNVIIKDNKCSIKMFINSYYGDDSNEDKDKDNTCMFYCIMLPRDYSFAR